MSSLDRLPKHSEIVHALNHIAGEYFELGMQLELQYEQLKVIENHHKGNQSRCLIETINLWQKNTAGECSWSALADAVKRVGSHDKLVRELRERDMAKDLMKADSNPQMLHRPTKRSHAGHLSLSYSTQSWPQTHDSRQSKDESGYSSNNPSGDSSGSETECFECRCASKQPCILSTHCAGGYPNPTTHRVSVPVLKEQSKCAAQSETPLKKGSYLEADCNKTTNDAQKSFGYNVQLSEDTRYSSKGDSAYGDSSGSEIEHFEKIPGCGCEKPCTAYALCAGECSKPTRTKVGVVRKQVQDTLPSEEEQEEEDYTDKFEKETRKMQVQFAELVSDTCDSLKNRNVATADLILFLQHASPLALKPKINEMTKATSLAQVLTIFTGQTCSWVDYEMMGVLINRFGDECDKKRLEQYEANFKKFIEHRLPSGNKHIEVGSGARQGGKKLVIKIDKEWSDVTFNNLNKTRGNIASILGARRSDLYLADIREGCILITLIITEELAGKLFPSRSCLTSSQMKSLRDEGVILLRCGKLIWRTVRKSPYIGNCNYYFGSLDAFIS